MLVAAGCKKATPANLAFVGVYSGTVSEKFDTSYTATVDTFTVRATSDDNQIAIIDSFSHLNFIGIVSGDSIVSIEGSLIIGTGCAAANFTGTGGLNGVILTLRSSAPITCPGISGIYSLNFFGTRN